MNRVSFETVISFMAALLATCGFIQGFFADGWCGVWTIIEIVVLCNLWALFWAFHKSDKEL